MIDYTKPNVFPTITVLNYDSSAVGYMTNVTSYNYPYIFTLTKLCHCQKFLKM
jgi:hypothetical protein